MPQNRSIAEIEKAIDDLSKQLEELRKELQAIKKKPAQAVPKAKKRLIAPRHQTSLKHSLPWQDK